MNVEEDIFSIAQSEIDDFRSRKIVLVPGDGDNGAVDITFNQYDMIRTIHRTYISKFKGGDKDSNNQKMFFYNISLSRAEAVTKNIDLDTKDLRAITEEGHDYVKTYFLQRAVNRWMKENNISQLLNQIGEELPVWGWVVLKTTGEKGKILEVVDLRHLVNDQAAKNLLDSPIIIEQHFLTSSDLREKEGVWSSDAIKEAIKQYKTTSRKSYQNEMGTNNKTTQSFIEVWEIHGEFSKAVFKDALNRYTGKDEAIEPGDEDEYVWAKIILAGVDSHGKKLDSKKPNESGLVLFCEEIDKDDIPYDEIYYTKVKGRCMPMGVVEPLIDSQAIRNESLNLFVQAMRLAAKQVYQTEDQTIESNLLSDLENGDILTNLRALQRVDTGSRGLADHSYVDRAIESNANLIANTPEVITGESLPSGTPYRLGSQLNVNANKLFEHKRENVGNVIRNVLNRRILPALIKDLKKEGIITLAVDEEEMQMIYESVTNCLITDKLKEYVQIFGRMPSPEEMTAINNFTMASIKKGGIKDVKYEEKYLDVKFSLDFLITNENIDKPAMLQSISSVIQTIGSNPQMLGIPMIKDLVNVLLEKVGLKPMNGVEGNIPQPVPVQNMAPNVMPQLV